MVKTSFQYVIMLLVITLSLYQYEAKTHIFHVKPCFVKTTLQTL